MLEREQPEFPQVCHNPGLGVYVDKGNDSTVWRVGTKILKVYSEMEFASDNIGKKLKVYMEVTNRASELARVENWQVEFGRNAERYDLRINPIEAIQRCGVCGTFVGTSLFIEGVTMADGIDYIDLQLTLDRTNFFLHQKLGEFAVKIVPCNLKKTDHKLVVTDLCSEIGNILVD